jgi:histidyl-tRNA synthetase
LELIGSPSIAADVEIIEMTVRFYEMLGLNGLHVLINSLGRDQCRARYREAILNHAEAMLKDQTTEFQERVQKNPLRLLDSKDPEIQALMKTAPSVLEYLEDDGKQKFEQIQALLTEACISYQVEPALVRGLDYYTDTVFEVQSTKLGAQSALCGGGRYDNLIKELGGPPTPSVGVAMGIERALMVVEEEGLLPEEPKPSVFVAYMSEETGKEAKKLVKELREQGLIALIDIDSKSLKSQLRQADKSGARHVIVVGEDEMASGHVALRNLATGEQKLVARGQVAALLVSL